MKLYLLLHHKVNTKKCVTAHVISNRKIIVSSTVPESEKLLIKSPASFNAGYVRKDWQFVCTKVYRVTVDLGLHTDADCINIGDVTDVFTVNIFDSPCAAAMSTGEIENSKSIIFLSR